MKKCDGENCCGQSAISRRTAIKAGAATSSLAFMGMFTSNAMAGPFGSEMLRDHLVPEDKKLMSNWLKSLVERGKPEVYSGQQLKYVGMPIGGVGCGQLYIGGDGRLWHWDIFKCNYSREPDHGQRINAMTLGGHYADPPEPSNSVTKYNGADVDQGFAIRITQEGKTQQFFLDKRSFADKELKFRGEYPVARINYSKANLPVEIHLTAFSPFIPLKVDDSALPATVLSFELKNTSNVPVEIDIAGYLENAICPYTRDSNAGMRRTTLANSDTLSALNFDIVSVPSKQSPSTRPDIVIADFEKDSFPKGWSTNGNAFSKGPMKTEDLHFGQQLFGQKGKGFANSYDPRVGEDNPDVLTGTITSKPIRINRNFLTFLVSGGNTEKTEVQLVVDSKVVHRISGRRDNIMRRANFDMSQFQGKDVVIKIKDDWSGAWGVITVDDIRLTDKRPPQKSIEQTHGFGSMSLAILKKASWSSTNAGLAGQMDLDSIFEDGQREHESSLDQRTVGVLGSTVHLAANESKSVSFVLSWYFPDYLEGIGGQMFASIRDFKTLRRHYAPWFNSAFDVVKKIADRWDYFCKTTLNWNESYYDSTLPYWLLDRAFVSMDCLATQTAHYFDSGRFYGWEGVDCCPGTCTHVWQYAQGMARIFPRLERGLRANVDYGTGFGQNGRVFSRGELSQHPAVDGQCGTILRVLREHRMTEDDTFLKMLWPKVKQSFEYLRKIDSNSDGLLDRHQEHTLDAWWSGEIAWISSLYIAAAAACQEMAQIVGDNDYSKVCASIMSAGRKAIVEKLFDGEYFVHKPSSSEPNAINTNKGCHIDQVMGQSFAFQVGLNSQRVIPKRETISALDSLWKYNFAPDAGQYSIDHTAIGPAFRWYAMPGEAGLLMTTWPKGGAEKAIPGRGERPKENPKVWTGPGGYFNECMNGFEYQAASHMIYEGEPESKLVEKGLAIFKAVHERYGPEKRNPYNEIECSDHYARSMASYGILLAVCGFQYDGPTGTIGFDPKISPENFKAPFTTANGWGTFGQYRKDDGRQVNSFIWKFGSAKIQTLNLATQPNHKIVGVEVRLGERLLENKFTQSGRTVTVNLNSKLKIESKQTLQVTLK